MTKGESLILLEKIQDECEKHIITCIKCPFFTLKDMKCVFQHSHNASDNYNYYKEGLQHESNK